MAHFRELLWHPNLPQGNFAEWATAEMQIFVTLEDSRLFK